ncbi:MAG: hypothetical protein ACFFAN_18550 [Promethearchaeota archaeon]
MPENVNILNDINKVFIPCRIILEMEALTSLYLAMYNYDQIKELPQSRPPSKKLIEIFKVVNVKPLERIIDYFINCTVRKVKPVVMYARNHHDIFRMGNVVPYTKSRVSVYFALHRLKLKFLFIKNFLDKFEDNRYKLDFFQTPEMDNEPTLLSVLYEDYYNKNKMNLKLMLPKNRVSERVSKLMLNQDSLSNEDIITMATSNFYNDDAHKIKFIMRGIKASIFVSKILFAQMDVLTPFSHIKETIIDPEEIMISNDFIPELIPAMSKSLSENNLNQLKECFKAFDFLMIKVLDGINHAIEIASGGLIKIDLEDTLYSSGNVFSDLTV